MNKTLYQLAYRNIQKYKKYYLYISIVILMVIVGVMSYTMIWDNYYEVQKSYNQDHYGQWYFMADFDDRKEILDKYIGTLNTPVEYGYDYVQGYYQEQYSIAHVTDNIYELCHLSLKEGTYPTKNNEIAISEDMSLAEKLKVGDQIEFSIDSKALQKYTIVGIVQNSKPLVKDVLTKGESEFAFPDIYTSIDDVGQLKVITDQELTFSSDDTVFIYNGIEYGLLNPIVNAYGYSKNATGNFQYTVQQTIVFVEVICLVVLGLNMTMSTSLKRRSQEFALLRGIGMTTRQLFLMVLYEILYLVIILMSIGMMLSVGLTYIIMLYYQTKLGYFVCHYSITKIILYGLLLIAIIIFSSVQPIFSSAKSSLTGAFDGKRFQYIQIRYQKLHYQKKWRLALREIKANKNLSLSFFIICSILVLSYTIKTMNNMRLSSFNTNYYQVTVDQEDAKRIKALNIPNTMIVRFKEVNINDDYTLRISSTEYSQLLSQYQLEGSIAQNNNEIIINESLKNDGYRIGDTIMIANKNFHVVGILSFDFKEDNNMVLPYIELYVPLEAYNQLDNQKEIYDIRSFYNTVEEKTKTYQLLKSQIEDYLFCSEYQINNSFETIIANIEDYMIVLPCIVCFLFCYFLNKNYVFNHYQDYTIYRLVGMTKKDLIVKEFFKAFFMSSFVFMIQVFWIMMTNIYYGRSDIPLISIGVCYAILLLALSIVYCLPLYGILKKIMYSL